jgi:hypothetical protein
MRRAPADHVELSGNRDQGVRVNIRRLFAVIAALFMALSVGTGMAAASPQQNPVYSLQNFLSGGCADVLGHSGDNHAAVANWHCDGLTNQNWEFRPIGDGSGYNYLVAVHSGKCLTVDISNANGDFGGDVVQDQCLGTATQMWRQDSLNNFKFLVLKYNNKCLDLDTRGGTGDGAVIHNWTCHNGNNQLWTLIPR